MNWGKIAQDRLADIARCSEAGAGVTRLPFTAQHREALDHIRVWMERAGLDVSLDNAGTMIGRYETGKAETFLFGSHQDSVREGGRYDGIMGVLLPCLALEAMGWEGRKDLPCSIEVLAFADEEGVRFPTALMGPRALAGTFDQDVLGRRDADGISLEAAMRDFGLEPDRIQTLARDPARIAGYLECHIEQGPVLEAQDASLGLVTAIAGIERHYFTLKGEAAHAGTAPMALRKDALTGAAEIILATEQAARTAPDLRATIGQLTLRPGAINAVPGQVEFPVELRARRDSDRRDLRDEVLTRATEIANNRGLNLSTRHDYEQQAVPVDPHLAEKLARAAAHAPALMSGATHDASAMADLCPIAMLFIRCRSGLSHNPAEYASSDDMGAAVACLVRFIGNMNSTGFKN